MRDLGGGLAQGASIKVKGWGAGLAHVLSIKVRDLGSGLANRSEGSQTVGWAGPARSSTPKPLSNTARYSLAWNIPERSHNLLCPSGQVNFIRTDIKDEAFASSMKTMTSLKLAAASTGAKKSSICC